jgi:hypothetical protein
MTVASPKLLDNDRGYSRRRHVTRTGCTGRVVARYPLPCVEIHDDVRHAKGKIGLAN